MKLAASITLAILCSTIALAAQEDSPLVRAAKIGAAKRRQLSGKHHIVIDDAYLKTTTGHISTASGSAELPPLPPPAKTTPPKVLGSGLSPAERENLRQQVKTLQKEGEKLAEQADQPYSDDGNEDQTARRLANIQKKLVEAERRLNPPQ